MKKWMIRKIRNMNIRSKIITIFMLLFLSLMIGALVIINYNFYNSSIKVIMQNVSSEMYMFGERFDYVYESIDQCSDISTKDINQIYEEYDVIPQSEVDYVEFRTGIYSTLYYNIVAYKGIEVFGYLDEYGRLISNSAELMFTKDSVSYIEDYIVKEEILARGAFFTCEAGLLAEDPRLNMWMIKKIISIETGETLGYLLYGVDTELLMEVFPDTYEYYYEQRYSLIDQNHNTVLSQEEDTSIYTEEMLNDIMEQGDGQYTYTMAGEENMIMAKYISNYDSYLLMRISNSDLNAGVRSTVTLFMVLGTVLILVGNFLIYILSGHITKPIVKLTRVAKLIQIEDYSQQCEVNSLDEVGVLANTFNVMTQKIRMQMKNIKEKQDTITKYQLDILNEQIKPHFLYNTLAAIHVLSQMGDSSGAARVAKELSNFYRLCLSSGNYLVSCENEVSNIKSYIYIQQLRYQDIVEFDVQIQDQILNEKMLKLTLQPLLENALYHGVKEKGEQGYIRVKGYRKENTIVFKVIDNGVGIGKDKLNQLRDNKFKSGYGLYNVNERIQLQFGSDYGVTICSKVGMGTIISVIIPSQNKLDELR